MGSFSKGRDWIGRGRKKLPCKGTRKGRERRGRERRGREGKETELMGRLRKGCGVILAGKGLDRKR